jgi:hypothetical protein
VRVKPPPNCLPPAHSAKGDGQQRVPPGAGAHQLQILIDEPMTQLDPFPRASPRHIGPRRSSLQPCPDSLHRPPTEQVDHRHIYASAAGRRASVDARNDGSGALDDGAGACRTHAPVTRGAQRPRALPKCCSGALGSDLLRRRGRGVIGSTSRTPGRLPNVRCDACCALRPATGSMRMLSPRVGDP